MCAAGDRAAAQVLAQSVFIPEAVLPGTRREILSLSDRSWLIIVAIGPGSATEDLNDEWQV